MARLILGVDEAGRGPLAGPVAVGVVAVPRRFDIREAFPGLRDSKKLSPQKREELYVLLRQFAKIGEVHYCVRFSSARTIDRLGMTRAVRNAVTRGVRALSPEPKDVHVLLDGLLHAPQEYEQETIIGGDGREPAIMLASVVAKVRRDRLMRLLSKRYPIYAFDVHKGYATLLHRKLIREHGPCELHRQLFCRKVLGVV